MNIPEFRADQLTRLTRVRVGEGFANMIRANAPGPAKTILFELALYVVELGKQVQLLTEAVNELGELTDAQAESTWRVKDYQDYFDAQGISYAHCKKKGDYRELYEKVVAELHAKGEE